MAILCTRASGLRRQVAPSISRFLAIKGFGLPPGRRPQRSGAPKGTQPRCPPPSTSSVPSAARRFERRLSDPGLSIYCGPRYRRRAQYRATRACGRRATLLEETVFPSGEELLTG